MQIEADYQMLTGGQSMLGAMGAMPASSEQIETEASDEPKHMGKARARAENASQPM